MNSKVTNLLLLALCFLLLLPYGIDKKGDNVAFTELMQKLADGEKLSDMEKQELLLESRKMQETASLIQSMIQPGSGTLKVDHLIANDAKIQEATILSAYAGDGDVSIDGDGVWIKNQQAAFGFEDTNNQRFNIYIASSGTDGMELNNQIPGADIILRVELTSGSAEARLVEDDALANRVMLRMQPATKGARLNVGDKFELRGEGSGGGETFMRAMAATNTPATPGENDAFHLYLRNDKLILQYNDAGTVRYKYLDMTGTGVTWVHTTVAP